MTTRKDDKTPPPSGGRAAERLREFERARGLRPAGSEPASTDGEAAGSQRPADPKKAADPKHKPKATKP
jgi:hypothetical protein